MPYKRPRMYQIPVTGGGTWNPNDSTTYYLASHSYSGATGATGFVIKAPRNGIIRALTLSFYTSANGGAEDVTVYVRVNDTTDYLIGTMNFNAAANPNTLGNYDLNIPILTTDFFNLKFVTPIWANNPTGVVTSGSILIEAH